MIGIFQNKNLTLDKWRKIEAKHLSNAKTLIDKAKKKSSDKIEPLCKCLCEALKISNIDDLFIADYNKLHKLKELCDNLNYLEHNINFGYMKELFEELYKQYRKSYGKELVEDLELQVCPYCNRNFINNTGKYATSQFDHFFPKSKYPMMALSLYNLIPCCPQCNHIKGEHAIDYSPYNKNFTTDQLLEFEAVPISVNDFSVEINAKSSIIEKNISVLLLNNAYEIHNDLAKELYLKTKMYTDSYKQSLDDIFQSSGLNIAMTLEEIYFGNFFTEEKYYLRPLSKFTRDIVVEFQKLTH